MTPPADPAHATTPAPAPDAVPDYVRALEQAAGYLPEEQQLLLELCLRAQSVAEVAAHLNLVVGVVMILADDLITAGLLDVHHTDPVEIELSMLTKMIERVRAI